MSNPESEEEFESAQEDDSEPSQERDEANAAAIEASTVTEDEKASDSNGAAIEKEPDKDEVAKEPDKDEVTKKPDVKTAEEEKSDSATEDQQEKEIEAKDIRHALKSLVKDEKPKVKRNTDVIRSYKSLL